MTVKRNVAIHLLVEGLVVLRAVGRASSPLMVAVGPPFVLPSVVMLK